MRTENRFITFINLLLIIIFFSSIGFGQSKKKNKKSTDPNSITVSYGKRIDSFAMKGDLFSLEIGFIRKRKFPFYIDLNYFQRNYEIRKTFISNGRPIVYFGFQEQTKAIEARFKIKKALVQKQLFSVQLKPFASVSYQYFEHLPLVFNNSYDSTQHDLNLGLGLGIETNLKLLKHVNFLVSMDYTFLRVGYRNYKYDDVLMPEILNIHKSFEFGIFDPYIIGRAGIQFLL